MSFFAILSLSKKLSKSILSLLSSLLQESDEHPADPSVTDHRRLIGGELSAEQEGDKHENNEEAIEESTSVRAKPTASHEANAERLREKGAARGGIAFLLQQVSREAVLRKGKGMGRNIEKNIPNFGNGRSVL